MGPNCPHCGADLGNIGFVPIETEDEDDDDDDELVDDDGPGPLPKAF